MTRGCREGWGRVAQERAVRTREQITAAAGVIFDEHGYGVSTNEIIKAAGTTKGAFYFHFPGGKEELATAILTSTLTNEGVRDQTPVLQTWLDTGLVLAHRLPQEPGLRAALRLAMHGRARDTYGTPWPAWIDITTQQLIDAQQAGELLSTAVPRRTAHIVAGAWSGIAVTTHAVYGNFDHFVEEVVDLYEHLLPNLALPGLIRRLECSVERARQQWDAHLAVRDGEALDGATTSA